MKVSSLLLLRYCFFIRSVLLSNLNLTRKSLRARLLSINCGTRDAFCFWAAPGYYRPCQPGVFERKQNFFSRNEKKISLGSILTYTRTLILLVAAESYHNLSCLCLEKFLIFFVI